MLIERFDTMHLNFFFGEREDFRWNWFILSKKKTMVIKLHVLIYLEQTWLLQHYGYLALKVIYYLSSFKKKDIYWLSFTRIL